MTPTSNGTRPTGERLPPADLDAEQGLLGALLMSSLAQWESVAHVEPSDFQKPAHQLVFEAIRTVWRTHATCDAVLVSAELRKMGLLDTVGGPAYLIELQAVTPSISHAPKYASVIITAAASRRMIHLAGQLSELGHDPGMDTADMFDRARQLLADNERALLAGEITTSTPYLSDLFHGGWQPPDWVVPGMLAAGHRMMIAGRGGVGKSAWLRQLALFAAAGFHPFRGDARNLYPIDAQPVLVVDLENDGPAWTAETRVMHDFLAAKAGVARLPIKVHALGGARYDPVGNRADRADLFARCHEHRPRLLMFGPIYKLDQLGGDEGWHKGAGGIQHLLDDIRAQFGCAILLESHVGKSGNDPRGAADWGYWPELGYTLSRRAKDGTSFNLRPFRPPRFASMYQWIPTEYVSGPRHMRFRAMWEDGAPVPDDGDLRPLWDREPDWADNQIPHEPF